MVKPINMAGEKIIGLGEPTDPGDAVNKAYVDDTYGYSENILQRGGESKRRNGHNQNKRYTSTNCAK